ncbi:MAG TPA: pirin family protein [Rhodanobacteraceae bacterium]|nr:pirin family protein [Rhodanobacteraceae bacterium]
MQAVRRAAERGTSNLGWLDSRHTFSFSSYYDPNFMGFGTLRVINEDRVQPGAGFDTHSHRDMEILSWVLEGALAHKDSMGSGEVLRPGELQRMTAGTGVTHSEFNASQAEPLHFLQIWLLPERQGLTPGYAQRGFADAELADRLCLVASHDGRDDSISVHQDVSLYVARAAAGVELVQTFAPNRRAWLQVARGTVEVDGREFGAGDAVAWIGARRLAFRAKTASEVLLFDLAG